MQRTAHQFAGQVWDRAIAADEERHEIHGTPRTLTRNIWRGLKSRRVLAPKKPRGRVAFFTRSEAARLLWANRGRPEAAWMAVGIYASLRAQEKAHLRVNVDVDLEALEIRVQPRTSPHPWRPKTDNGVREIPIHPRLARWLRAHVRDGYAGFVYFFRTPTGGDRPLARTTGVVWAKKAIQAAGLPYGRKAYSDHTCRHTFASWLVQRDVQLKKIAELMGTTTAVVDNIYGHLLPSDRRAVVEKL